MLLIQDWGVDLASQLVPSLSTKAYTDFLDKVAINEVKPRISSIYC